MFNFFFTIGKFDDLLFRSSNSLRDELYKAKLKLEKESASNKEISQVRHYRNYAGSGHDVPFLSWRKNCVPIYTKLYKGFQSGLFSNCLQLIQGQLVDVFATTLQAARNQSEI